MSLDSTADKLVHSVVLTGFGDTSQLKIEEWPLPKPGPGEVEILVHCCGMNFADIYTRLGIVNDKKPPFILGLECSGIVTAVGDSGNNDGNLATTNETFIVGDRVVCYDFTGGLYRDRVVVSKKKCFRLPDYINFRDGAAIFVNYLTAYFSLIKMGSLRYGETVLIQSCAGGVGWAATQFAHTVSGVTVIGTASAAKHDAVFANGVKYPLEYLEYSEKIREISPKGVDIVIENQGGKDFITCQNLLRPFGRIVIIGANSMVTQNDQSTDETQSNDVRPVDLIVNNRTVCGIHLGLLCETENERVRRTFANICSMIKEGSLKPRIDSVWPMSKIVEATKRIEERKNIGKVILTVI